MSYLHNGPSGQSLWQWDVIWIACLLTTTASSLCGHYIISFHIMSYFIVLLLYFILNQLPTARICNYSKNFHLPLEDVSCRIHLPFLLIHSGILCFVCVCACACVHIYVLLGKWVLIIGNWKPNNSKVIITLLKH